MKKEMSSIENSSNGKNITTSFESTFGFLGELGFWITISALIPGFVYVISGGTAFLRIMVWILLVLGGVLSFMGIMSKSKGKAIAGLITVMIISVVGLFMFGGNKSEIGNGTSGKTTNALHQNNIDGYYDGHYSFRRGLEYGDLEIRGDGWAVTYVDCDPLTGSYSPHSFNGRIEGSNLVIGNAQYSYDNSYVGGIFAEFDGKNISSSGWTYTR